MMRRGEEVTAHEMEALLAELQDAGGTIDGGNGTRPYVTTPTRGTAGTTNILSAQQVTRTGRSRTPSVGGAVMTPNSRRNQKPPATSAAATAAAAAAQFSSYAPVGLSEQELRTERHNITPLGVRLTPLPVSPSGGGAQGFSPAAAAAAAAASPLKKAPVSPSKARAVSGRGGRSSVGLEEGRSTPGVSPVLALGQTPLPALPAIAAGDGAGLAAQPPAGPRRAFSFRSNYREFVAEEDRREGNSGANPASPPPPPSQQQQQQQQQGVVKDGQRPVYDEAAAYREANFLPIMCARYLNPAGLTPPPRWGHSLTAVGGGAGAANETRLYMFGGMELSGADTDTLAQFDAHAISWEPSLVLTPAPAPRYSHAAVAHEDRYLIIHGGAARSGAMLFGDMHMFDTVTHRWQCLWEGPPTSYVVAGGGGKGNRNVPAPRFGHTMVIRDDRLYIFGGKIVKAASSRGASTTGMGGEPTAAPKLLPATASTDVYVFSLNSRRWKKRIRAGGDGKRPGGKDDGDNDESARAATATIAARAYHAATLRGDRIFVNGGVDDSGTVLADTWCLDLNSSSSSSSKTAGGGGGGPWRCVHRGDSADAIPRERHSLFACGEALMVVGGCSGSSFNAAIAGKYNNFVSVMPVAAGGAGAGTAAAAAPHAPACWIPVAMGNVSIVAPNKKNFAAAFVGGFVYVFGGLCGSETATNTMVRFLAADGYMAADARATAQSNDLALRALLQQLRERPPVPHDTIVVTDNVAAGTGDDDDKRAAVDALLRDGAAEGGGELRETRFHKVLLQQRAPKLLEALQACRSEVVTVPVSASTAAMRTHRRSSLDGNSNNKKTTTTVPGATSAAAGGDTVDSLLRDSQAAGSAGTKNKNKNNSNNSNNSSGVVGQFVTYYTSGSRRVAALPHPLTPAEFSCLADYIYWGGLPGAFKQLLHDEEPEKDADADDGVAATSAASVRQGLQRTLEALKVAAEDYALAPLGALVDALLAGSRRQLQKAQEKSSGALRADMEKLLNATGGGATCTVLFADPHTKHQVAHALHPAVIMLASQFFRELLRPIFSGERAAFQVSGVAAKLTSAPTTTTTGGTPSSSPSNAGEAAGTLLFSGAATVSKRALLVGPVSVPRLAVQPILRYLYTQQLHAPREVALEVMFGAHQLGLPLLQAYCEALVAREEVNYDTCCSFYFLAKKYRAALLEETSLLTAVLGYAEVRHQPAYHNLSDEDRRSIDAVAAELGSSTWVPPPQPTAELKSSDAYAARWGAAAPK